MVRRRQHDVVDPGLGQPGDLVLEERHPADLEQVLGPPGGQRQQPGAEAPGDDHGLDGVTVAASVWSWRASSSVPYSAAIDRSPPLLAEPCCAPTPARPLVTFYDDATGERVELSVATYANWVAKTAGLAQDELDARARRPGARRPADALARRGLARRGLEPRA